MKCLFASSTEQISYETTKPEIACAMHLLVCLFALCIFLSLLLLIECSVISDYCSELLLSPLDTLCLSVTWRPFLVQNLKQRKHVRPLTSRSVICTFECSWANRVLFLCILIGF